MYHSHPSQKLRCCSNSAACSADRAPSRNSVTSSTTSWQETCSWECSSAIEVLLERGTDPRARAVQQHALVAFAHIERRADLLGRIALDVAHADHRLLGGRQRGDRA